MEYFMVFLIILGVYVGAYFHGKTAGYKEALDDLKNSYTELRKTYPNEK